MKSSLTSFLVALFISIILIAAAFGKIFYPRDLFFSLDVSAALFEIFFSVFLLLFFKRAQMWLAASLVFSAWAGYAYFWLAQGLSCGCMEGLFFNAPKGFPLGLDLIFFALSLFLAFFRGARKKVLISFLLVAPLMGVFGFLFGNWIACLA